MTPTNRETMVSLLRQRGIHDKRVLGAMASVPRDEFVPQAGEGNAYGDHALPIGQEQTISQPYIVALMTTSLELKEGDKVLEIGTGSGYQAAVLAEMGMDVYSIERIPELYEAARERLARLKYDVKTKLDDGYSGWEEYAPYDGIIVTAAAPQVPQPLLEQLAEGGRMMIPVGQPGTYQTLWKLIKKKGEIRRINLGGVAFVPFISEGLR